MFKKTIIAASAAALAISAIAVGSAQGGSKTTICHYTASETNPFVIITISDSAVDSHLANHGEEGFDVIVEDGDCDNSLPPS